jgi:hypothetical protein
MRLLPTANFSADATNTVVTSMQRDESKARTRIVS